MYRLLETIRIDYQGINNLEYHNFRCNQARKSFNDQLKAINLADYISLPLLPPNHREVIKCRVIYAEEVESVGYAIYTKKTINTLRLVEDNGIKYALKYENRTALNDLFNQKEACDDVLIVKNGKITDTSYCNILFADDDGKTWYTPDQPLLKGTMRARLLEENLINEMPIRVEDLNKFTRFKLINAMFKFDDEEKPIKNIVGRNDFPQ